MARIWFEGDGRVARDREGKKFVRKFLCIDAHGVQLYPTHLTDGKQVRKFAGTGSLIHTILAALLLCQNFISNEEFITLCYPDPDKEPDWADNIIKVRISTLRDTLRPFGLSIACRYGQGYKIVTLEEFAEPWNQSRRGRNISKGMKEKSHA